MNSYHVLGLVGEGSFGRVYKGRKKCTGQVVALKFIPKLDRSVKELQSLKREIEILTDLQHPNIVQLYDSFETKTEIVVVTEYAEGQLFQILQGCGNLPESQVREIACQLVSALYYLHSHRILHRDMKPQNILLGEGGAVKLCDFGFARAMSNSTMVLTSIKGTPLYMCPELVEERPYDHTSDLWSLGCILYELHTGAPPFYTNSIFQLVQLIVRDQVKWPDTMSKTCTSFLKGLLTKDPEKRLSWPDLLHHPFVADCVLVLEETNVSSPLTVTPSPDMMALKLQQVAAKTVPTSGRRRLLQNHRQQRDNRGRRKPVRSAEVTKDGVGNTSVDSTKVVMPHRARTHPSDGSVTRTESRAANPVLSPKNQACVRSQPRGQISIDYEREFLYAKGGSRLLGRRIDTKQTSDNQQNVDSEEYWEKLAQQSDQSTPQRERFNYNAIIPQLKAKIGVFKIQLTGGAVEEAWQIHQPLKVLRNLLLTPDLKKSKHIGQELELPHVLLDVVHLTVENSDYVARPWSLSALGEIIAVLMIYWDKHPDWTEDEHRLEELTKPFLVILSQPDFSPLSPLAASVLCLFTQHNVDVKADVNDLTSLLQNLLLDSYEPLLSLPSGWGLCDGLLSLLLHTLSEQHENGSGFSTLDPALFLDLWKKVGTLLAETTADTDFCSANGLFSFLSAAFFLFIEDPYSCVPLFSESGSKSVDTLGRLLGADRLPLLAEHCSPRRLDVDLNHDSFTTLSCHLLCFPFGLDLPPHTLSTILLLYDSCGIVESLAQVIQTLPPLLLELPLSLLSRMLLCDPERSVPHLRKAACGLFLPTSDRQLTASKHQTLPSRTVSSLLFDLLQRDELWDSAVELLTLLSQIARSTRPAGLQLHLDASVLQQALAHRHHRIRATTCILLGYLDPLRPPALPSDIFKSLIGCLQDSYSPMRRRACRTVGNWLGCIAAGAGLSNEKKQKNHKYLDSEPAGDLEMDDEEGEGWVEEARKAAATLVSLITEPDPLTRRHCCAALGNLLNVEGAMSLLLKKNIYSVLQRVACTDSHNAVRQAAISTLSLFSEEDTMRETGPDVP